ncbi:NUDIX domain-containing protein [Agrococcus sediminis]|jgi:8-oxo-dGTP diphosphatase|uniref:NUDIX domain-containing protein n=1 Tax=Agrococcus sediminis TaxID=2599924 RepID=A0A5M8QMT0_9MICO|nr:MULTISPECIES: NUDIX domain-containing protein [Agrococcus]KAA6436046.1 NUDIX domain-containing protein [Agrococcus sediminis]MDR7233718.1 8-oxo-dGTP pyrophosphatase MutT (NUDIX family) [Agrococcus sp. BE272]RWR24981.1 NUDIX domain-containing protein [Agrococcus lahaulensis]UOW01788.1 NUDIX domain-containing protein [Agrococcus sp. SCSIO52902]
MRVITVSAICFERADGAVLTVRKRGTSAWMLPGGKPEPGETAAECAVREVREELGVEIALERIEPMGDFETRAANEAGFALRASVFRTRDAIEPRAQAEIEAVRWIVPAIGVEDEAEAPLNREHVFPLLLAELAAAER